MAPDPFIGARVKELMKERGWSQKELSDHSGVAYTSVSRHLNNRTGVNEGNQARYASAFRISVIELLGDAADGDRRLDLVLVRLAEVREEAADRLEVLNETLLGIQARLAGIEGALAPRARTARARSDP